MTYQRKAIIVFASISLGCLAAYFFVTHRLRTRQRLAREISITKAKAEAGDSDSEVALGKDYYYGRGLPQSYSDAFHWNSKAAESGNSQAEYVLGILYQRGKGVPQSFSDAFNWYQKAANQGHGWAQVGLGTLYYQGQGVQQNYVLAAGWYRTAAQKDLAKAQYLLGYMYEYGQGVSQSSADAEMWYLKASQQGDDSAERALGLRGSGLSRTNVLVLGALALAWGWVATHLLSSKERFPRQRVRAITATVCGLAYVAMRSFAAVAGFQSFIAIDVFRLLENMILGLAIGIAFDVSSRNSDMKEAMRAVIVAALLLNALFILLHRDLWSLSSHNQVFLRTASPPIWNRNTNV